jgi:hypothetical protein
MSAILKELQKKFGNIVEESFTRVNLRLLAQKKDKTLIK